jgi:GrpB-like predicted nucleotidyltransferase (UPF0157 family)
VSEEQPALPGVTRGRVVLADYTPRWARLFEEEAERLRAALGPLARGIEHYGSTSVPGLVAKPILDVLVGADAPDDPALFVAALAPLGYEHASWAGVPGHHVFGRGERRTHLVHVVRYGGEEWRAALRFRDALRADPALAAEYARLKRGLAERFPDDRASYTEAKTGFVRRVVRGRG